MAIENLIEKAVFRSRWILAPFYLGLVVVLVILLIKFALKLVDTMFNIWSLEGTQAVLPILSLIDFVLVSNLLLIIIFSGYENFVSKLVRQKGMKIAPIGWDMWIMVV
jgi:uncharacterized protein (TIGR00645 family)